MISSGPVETTTALESKSTSREGGLPGVPKQVFISYAIQDLEIAARVRDDLEADGIVCWMAGHGTASPAPAHSA